MSSRKPHIRKDHSIHGLINRDGWDFRDHLSPESYIYCFGLHRRSVSESKLKLKSLDIHVLFIQHDMEKLMF